MKSCAQFHSIASMHSLVSAVKVSKTPILMAKFRISMSPSHMNHERCTRFLTVIKPVLPTTTKDASKQATREKSDRNVLISVLLSMKPLGDMISTIQSCFLLFFLILRVTDTKNMKPKKL
uniref:Uncharacterized protein n=1 Tax=Glossina brevipalpis TaxID=37001 RepID=A0A1A9WHA8_9MUSC